MIQICCLMMGKMNCNGCVGNITRVLQSFPGVEVLSSDLATKKISVRYDPELVNFQEVEQALVDARYPVISIAVSTELTTG
ncbi:hypothetical protein KDW_54010 [Dictyobacter vulcani]|uniref:HMA domain-containing protein n=1 Tax=Dictyobacter vulcani TaxID=2607529 RepID=A0A5J4KYL0_9CHLR|nr:heavy metal-associated domain-containing protein [Dictyobacter vulcani]GER91239.1 hypothetical protein KDW_54010 [Dictyobacter vulcani]